MGKKKKKKNKPVQKPVEKRYKLLMATLRRELQDSDECARAVRMAAEAHYKTVWDPYCPQPQVREVETMLNCANEQLILTGMIHVECAGRFAAYRVTERIPMVLDEGKTEEELIPPNRLALQSLGQLLIDKVPKSLPQSSEEYLLKYVPIKHPELDAIVRKIAAQPDVMAILNQQIKVFQSDYASLLENVPCPSGFQPAQIASLHLCCCTSGSIGRCALQIDLDCGGYFRRQAEYPLGSCPFYINENSKREYLRTRILECVKDLVNHTGDVPRLFFAPSLPDIPGMTEHLEMLLQQGSASLGHVTLLRKGIQPEKALVLYRLPEDRNIVRIGSSGADLSAFQSVPLCLDVQEQPVIPLEQYSAIPNELAGLCRLGEALERALDQAFQDKNMPAPAMMLYLSKNAYLMLHCGRRSLSLKPSEKSAGRKLMQFVTQTVEAEQAKTEERQRQLEVLNTLNPTELTVLRHVAANGEAWYTSVAEAIDDRVCTTKVYTGACLKRLAELKAPVGEDDKPLLQCRTAYNKRCDAFNLYRLEPGIDRITLEMATGRPFMVKETAVIKRVRTENPQACLGDEWPGPGYFGGSCTNVRPPNVTRQNFLRQCC